MKSNELRIKTYDLDKWFKKFAYGYTIFILAFMIYFFLIKPILF